MRALIKAAAIGLMIIVLSLGCGKNPVAPEPKSFIKITSPTSGQIFKVGEKILILTESTDFSQFEGSGYVSFVVFKGFDVVSTGRDSSYSYTWNWNTTSIGWHQLRVFTLWSVDSLDSTPNYTHDSVYFEVR